MLADYLTSREQEGYYDPDYYVELDDAEDDGALRVCGEPHPTSSYGHCTLPPGHGHHVHQTARGAQWPRSGS